MSVLGTRGEGWTREVKVDRRVPRLADAFPDRTWVTVREFVRRVRTAAVEELEASWMRASSAPTIPGARCMRPGNAPTSSSTSTSC